MLRRRISVLTAATLAVSAMITSPVHASPGPFDTSPGPVNEDVIVELRTADTDSVVAQVAAVGGIVTGEVPQALVQASVPSEAVEQLGASNAIDDVRTPQRFTRLHQFGSFNTGTDEILNAPAWHEAGLTGLGIKVGVIDLFSMARWDVTENGPLPKVANGHLFCKDSSGVSPSYCFGSDLNPMTSDTHGLSVVEQIKDVAPGAEIYVATVGTTADLMAAVDFFADRGVRIINRSMGDPLDGPGDGTGPLAEVVNHAVRRGITWFNSTGNDARGRYVRATIDPSAPAGESILLNGDPLLGISGRTLLFDGVRWNDWGQARPTDYRVELCVPNGSQPTPAVTDNPPLTSLTCTKVDDRDQVNGMIPLEADDFTFSSPSNVTFLRIVRNAATLVGDDPDIIEIAIAPGPQFEPGAASSPYTAARSVVDSANPGLLAVGAVDPPSGTTVASYSSRGPTNDGRIKPDIVAPSGLPSFYRTSPFSGTSAASPAAAGAGALLLHAGLADTPAQLGTLVRSMTVDIAAPGPDNDSGHGMLGLPAPPPPPDADQPGQFHAFGPTRVLDTRENAYGPVSVRQPGSVVVVGVRGQNGLPANATAVALNVTVVDSLVPGFVQVFPTGAATLGASSNQNLDLPGPPRPAFVISRVGADGSVSAYLHGGGHLIIDVLGYYTPAAAAEVNDGRLVTTTPERWVDTREPALLPAGFTATRQVAAGETVRVVRPASSGLPSSGIGALVVNLTVDRPQAPGFLSAGPTGNFRPAATSNVNHLFEATSNLAIVPVGADGTISVYSLARADVIVDVVGYITDASAPASASGLFVSLSPQRLLDTRPPAAPYSSQETRRYRWVGPSVASVPADASALSLNLTVTLAEARGFLTAFPDTLPPTSNLNYLDVTNANASILRIGPDSTVGLYMLAAGHVIVDLTGYFTGP